MPSRITWLKLYTTKRLKRGRVLSKSRWSQSLQALTQAPLPPRTASVTVIQVGGQEDLQSVLADLTAQGMPARDMTGNELAKLHARYLAGGRSATVKDEVLYRFEFPEVCVCACTCVRVCV